MKGLNEMIKLISLKSSKDNTRRYELNGIFKRIFGENNYKFYKIFVAGGKVIMLDIQLYNNSVLFLFDRNEIMTEYFVRYKQYGVYGNYKKHLDELADEAVDAFERFREQDEE